MNLLWESFVSKEIIMCSNISLTDTNQLWVPNKSSELHAFIKAVPSFQDQIMLTCFKSWYVFLIGACEIMRDELRRL